MLGRFCTEPEIPALLRREPELIPNAVHELLRLDPPFVSVGRTAVRDAELGGRLIKAGDKVLIHWASANRDHGEFGHPDGFDLGRERNRHFSFGVGPHRCAGSNLARMNLRIALEDLLWPPVDSTLAAVAARRCRGARARAARRLPRPRRP